MTLTLITPNYQPPTAYAILEDPQFAMPGLGRALFDVVEALKGTGWFRQLSQYGVTDLNFVGMLDSITDATQRTIHFVLPRSPGNVPGFMTQWAAYHTTLAGDFIFSWNPFSSQLGVDGWMIGATHELIEALLDAEPGYGWVNMAAHDEAADDCERLPGIPFAGTLVSSYWLNNVARCFALEDL